MTELAGQILPSRRRHRNFAHNRITVRSFMVATGDVTSSVGRRAEPARKSMALLRAHPIFGELRVEDLRRLSAIAIPRSFKRGATIFKKGDAGTCLYAINRGSVKISVPGNSGREAMFNILGEEEVFGEVALLDGQPRTADAVAITDCELFAINRRDFLALMNWEPKVAIRIIELLCQRLRRASEHFEDLLFLDAAARLAKTLLRLPYQAQPDGRRIAITQQEVSQMIGLSRESTNKQLRDWQERGWLRLSRGGVILLAIDSIAGVVREDAASG
jgi:CRP-like cAMP-binding protein